MNDDVLDEERRRLGRRCRGSRWRRHVCHGRLGGRRSSTARRERAERQPEREEGTGAAHHGGV